jgi:outer membrane murein-binding lipoprotein Lpp
MKMKRLHTAISLFICAAVLAPLAGCQNSTSPSSDSRQSKLLTAENHRLHVRLQQLENDLRQCSEEKEKAKKEADETVSFVMTTVREESEKEAREIRDENEKLKVQIQKLEEQLRATQK